MHLDLEGRLLVESAYLSENDGISTRFLNVLVERIELPWQGDK